MIKAIIFDLDGTLLDSMHVWDGVGSAYLSKKHIVAKDDLQEHLNDMSLYQAAQFMKEEYQLDESVRTIQQGIEDCVFRRYQNEVPLKDGAKECIERCIKAGYTLCILTASSQAMASSALKRFGIDPSFSFIMSCDEAGCSKSDPMIYQKAMEKLRCTKDECICIDDAYYAISCMKKAGYQVYAIYDEANANDWKAICEIADRAYMTLGEWEVTNV